MLPRFYPGLYCPYRSEQHGVLYLQFFSYTSQVLVREKYQFHGSLPNYRDTGVRVNIIISLSRPGPATILYSQRSISRRVGIITNHLVYITCPSTILLLATCFEHIEVTFFDKKNILRHHFLNYIKYCNKFYQGRINLSVDKTKFYLPFLTLLLIMGKKLTGNLKKNLLLAIFRTGLCQSQVVSLTSDFIYGQKFAYFTNQN